MTVRRWQYLPDYDNMAKLIKLGDDEIIKWTEARVNKMLIAPLEEIRKIFNKTTDKNAIKHIGLCISTVIFCAVESFGRFLEGEGDRRGIAGRCFKSFISRYMVSFKRYQNTLWDRYRNCLAHGFRITKGRIRTCIECLYIAPRKSEMGVLEIELWNFFDEFIQAIATYFKDLKEPANICLRRKFVDSFGSLYGYWIRYWKKESRKKHQ